ncbi:hypothetical protein XFF4834R_chr42780 [Xanthomonas citri pv. fuscans]|nr:hypothetical protein XFF4834R_chr42780 [Xanthomonas citri pv. fuscans]
MSYRCTISDSGHQTDKGGRSAQAPIVRCWRFHLARQFYGGRCAEAARPAGSRFCPPVLMTAYRPPPFLRVRSRLQQGRFSTRRTKTTRQPAGVMSRCRKRKNRPCQGGFFITGLAGKTRPMG